MKKIALLLLNTLQILYAGDNNSNKNVVELYVMNQTGGSLLAFMHDSNQATSLEPACWLRPGIGLQTITINQPITHLRFKNTETKDITPNIEIEEFAHYLIWYKQQILTAQLVTP